MKEFLREAWPYCLIIVLSVTVLVMGLIVVYNQMPYPMKFSSEQHKKDGFEVEIYFDNSNPGIPTFSLREKTN